MNCTDYCFHYTDGCEVCEATEQRRCVYKAEGLGAENMIVFDSSPDVKKKRPDKKRLD